MDAERRQIKGFRIINHGAMHGQYFQGHGLAYGPWTGTATGVGDTPGEALNDALEMLGYDWDGVELVAESVRGQELTKAEGEPAHAACLQEYISEIENDRLLDQSYEDWHSDCEVHYFVSVDVREEE